MALIEVIERQFRCAQSLSKERAPLSNAQVFMLKRIEALVGVNNINVTVRVDLPSTATVDTVVSKIQAMVEAHSAFRTLFPLDENGVRYQQPVLDGTLEISVISAVERTVDDEARACLSAFLADPFEIDDHLPIRSGVITKDGVPVVLAMAFSHLILDRWSLRLVREALSSYMADSDVTILPGIEDWSPVDQGRVEQSDTFIGLEKTRLLYWKNTLELFPPCMLQFDVERPLFNGAWRNVRMQSSALHHAMTVLSRQYEIPTGTILISAFAVTLANYFDIDVFAAEVMFSNRVERVAQGAIGQYAQTTPVAMEIRKSDFGTLLKQLQVRLLRAYQSANVPPNDVDIILADLGAKRINAAFNIDHSADSASLNNSTTEQLLASLENARAHGVMTDENQWDYDWNTVYVESHSARDVLLRFDTRVIPVDQAQDILIKIEATIVEMAVSGPLSIWPVIDKIYPRRKALQ